MTILPLFPLGSPLLPAMVLPLHLFEERYRQLIADVMNGGEEFGVVLIEKGFEVGGDDVRAGVGTVARVLEAEEFDDGRWFIVTVGTRRFRVVNWLEDDPYPRAEVEDWPDEPLHIDLTEQVGEVIKTFTRCMGLAAEAGYDVGQVPEISPDPEIGVTQLAALAPVNAHDRHQFLCAPGPPERLDLIASSLEAAVDRFRFELTD